MKEVLLYKEMREHHITGVQVLLDHHQVPYRVADENTGVLLGEIMASAIGGIKIYVPEDRYSEAKELLTKNGFITEEQATEEASVNPDLSKMATLFFKYQKVLLWTGLALILAIIVWVIADQPSEFESMVNKDWCVEAIVVESPEQIKELQQQIDGNVQEAGDLTFLNYNCEQSLHFKNTGKLDYSVGRVLASGSWNIDGDSLVIDSGNDSLTFLNGKFMPDVEVNRLYLRNQQYEILLYKERTWGR
jgi:hypothetical protein